MVDLIAKAASAGSAAQVSKEHASSPIKHLHLDPDNILKRFGL